VVAVGGSPFSMNGERSFGSQDGKGDERIAAASKEAALSVDRAIPGPSARPHASAASMRHRGLSVKSAGGLERNCVERRPVELARRARHRVEIRLMQRAEAIVGPADVRMRLQGQRSIYASDVAAHRRPTNVGSSVRFVRLERTIVESLDRQRALNARDAVSPHEAVAETETHHADENGRRCVVETQLEKRAHREPAVDFHQAAEFGGVAQHPEAIGTSPDAADSDVETSGDRSARGAAALSRALMRFRQDHRLNNEKCNPSCRRTTSET
jgi:hypothetical protein